MHISTLTSSNREPTRFIYENPCISMLINSIGTLSLAFGICWTLTERKYWSNY